MRRFPAAALLLLAVALAAPASAAATPEDDFRAVADDYRPDKDVTACRFTREQLVNAHNQANTPDLDNYGGAEFRAEVRAEIARHDAGGCKVANKKVTKVANLKIVKVRPRRGFKESVTVKNLGKRRASIRGVRLRDRGGARLKLGNVGIKPGKSLRVFTGCAKGKRRFIRLKSRAFACRKTTVWNDRGDVVRLVAANRTLLSRAGYGRFRSVQRF